MNIVIPTDDNGEMTDLSKIKNAIFLAGPCPREDYENQDKWRKEAYDILEDIGFDGYVLNPTNKNYSKMKDLEKQTNWEHEAMMKASAIVFWLERSEIHPGFTSNYECGEWMNNPRVYIGIPENSKTKNANKYISIKAKQAGKKVYSNLKDMLLDVTYDLEQGGKIWFTSDTHFGQERTLELSRRPFKNVEEMNLEIMSNWNKRVTMKDTVYFLGDLGDKADYLNCLNFGKLSFIKGNYERDKLPEIIKDLEKIDNIEVFENDEVVIKPGKFEYTLRHEPLSPLEMQEKPKKDVFYLYGHIHNKSNYKRNGLEVGTDAYAFCPVELEEVDWRANSIINKILDENVYTDNCL